MPILRGRLRGTRWIVGAHTHGCWLGTYELKMQQQMEALVRPGSVFCDIGAQAGFYTLLASRLTGEKGRVFAFEPSPRNIHNLRRHLEINWIENVTLFEAAVSDRPGEAWFDLGNNSSTGSLSDSGSLCVPLVSLDHLLEEGQILPPDFLKMDVEGAELQVLKGARKTLTTARPTLFLATHSDQLHRDCLSFLESLGFACESSAGGVGGEHNEILARPREAKNATALKKSA